MRREARGGENNAYTKAYKTRGQRDKDLFPMPLLQPKEFILLNKPYIYVL